MNYAEIPYVNRPVSRILLGTASPSFLKGEDNPEILDAALEAGITTLDTARNYGLSEKSVGKWLKERGCRDRVVLLSKCAHPEDGRKRVTEADIREDFDVSSELLGTDYIDIYLLHRDDPEVPAGAVAELMNALHEEGKIGAFGGSNWTVERIREVNAYAEAHGLIPFTVSSPHFSLAYQQQDPWGGGCVTVTGKENSGARQWYRETQMPLIAYSSLGRGLLSGRLKSRDRARAGEILDAFAMKGYGCEENYERLSRCEILAEKKGCTVPQLAMAWMFSRGLNVFAVATMSAPERIRENLKMLELTLTPEESRWLNLEEETPICQ